MVARPTVFLVEDNPADLNFLTHMLQRERIWVEGYASANDLLRVYDPSRLGCLVLDLHLPEMTGWELRGRLAQLGCQLPFIIITSRGEIPDATDAIRRGAVDFLEKPIGREVFLRRVWQALAEDEQRRCDEARRAEVQARYDSLTRREREVLEAVIAGNLSKQIARQLGITIKTVEAHRSNIIKKMQVDSVVQLVRVITEHRFHCAAPNRGSCRHRPDELSRPWSDAMRNIN